MSQLFIEQAADNKTPISGTLGEPVHAIARDISLEAGASGECEEEPCLENASGLKVSVREAGLASIFQKMLDGSGIITEYRALTDSIPVALNDKDTPASPSDRWLPRWLPDLS